MFLSDFDFELPDDLIARYPTSERRGSRLLVVGDALSDRGFADLAGLLRPNDLLVFNDTRVIKARLRGIKDTGGQVEILLERLLQDDDCLAQIRASKSPKPGTVINFSGGASAQVIGRDGAMYHLRWSEPLLPFLEKNGEVPLPPYLGREEESADDERYQTVYAEHPGAVAAPTAGLHFDSGMLAETAANGIRHAFVTLHVGAGTFQSLRNEDVDSNQLHSERLIVGSDTVDAVRETRQSGGRVIAVGTTSVRALEAASADCVLDVFDGETALFIRPGYTFRSVDAMLTNFHLPKSSLLMLVAAFAGHQRTMNAYRHAVKEAYRFFSYGDAMLVWPETK